MCKPYSKPVSCVQTFLAAQCKTQQSVCCVCVQPAGCPLTVSTVVNILMCHVPVVGNIYACIICKTTCLLCVLVCLPIPSLG